MSVEAITKAIHEYMYEKLNDSPNTQEGRKSDMYRREKSNTLKNKQTETQKTGLQHKEHSIGPTNIIVRQEERNSRNAVNPDNTPNAAASHGK